MYVVESITKKSIVEITFRTNIGNGQSVKLKVSRNGMDKVNGGRREKEDRDRRDNANLQFVLLLLFRIDIVLRFFEVRLD